MIGHAFANANLRFCGLFFGDFWLGNDSCNHTCADSSLDEALTGVRLPRMDGATFRDFATEAIRYWEPRRLIYDALLAVIVIAYFALGYPASKVHFEPNEILGLFLLAVMANVAYCAVYR